MNKKGSYGFGLLVTVFIIVIVAITLAGLQNGADLSSVDKTMETLNWSVIGNTTMASINKAAMNTDNDISKSVIMIVSKAIDFIGYSIFEVAKLALVLVKENPNLINYKILLAVVFISLLAPAIYPVFIIVVSLILIIKEAILNKREKRKLKEFSEK